MSIRALRFFIPGFVLVYVAIGYGRWAANLPEVYPVGAFAMFQRVKPFHQEYDLVVHRLGGRELDPPASAREEPDRAGVVLDGHRLLVVNGYVLRMHEGNPSAEQYRDYLDRWLGPDSRYEVVAFKRISRSTASRKAKREVYGPFVTSPSLDPTPPGRFQFEEDALDKERDPDAPRRVKRRKAP